MTAPTRVLSVKPAIGWLSSAHPKVTPAFNVTSGDLLVVSAVATVETDTLAAPTWTGTGTWTLQQSVVISGYCPVWVWTCLVGATATGVTISVENTAPGSDQWGFEATLWRGHNGVGATGKANATGSAPSLALTCSADSAAQTVCGDWNASDGATRAWLTVNGSAITEADYWYNVNFYTGYTGYHPNTGAAGAKTFGLSAPSMKFSIVGAEILGTGTAPPSQFSGWGFPASVSVAPVVPVNTTMYNAAIYGSGVGFDCKANLIISANESASVRFKAGTTSTIASVRNSWRTGAGYSLGTGGTMSMSIQADDGTGKPSGTKLSQGTQSAGDPGAREIHVTTTMTPALAVTAGTIYHVVYENASATNYASINCAYYFEANAQAPLAVRPAQLQPMFNNADFAVLLTTSYGGAWSDTAADAKGYMMVIDIIYANGYHDGQSYYENMVDYPGAVSGAASMIRESFTLTGGDRSVSSASVRVRRQSGTADLVLTLSTAAGVVAGSGTIPATSVPIVQPNGGYGGAVWVTANFGSSVSLANGVAYNLRLSTAAGTTYSADAIRNGTDAAGTGDQGYLSYDFPGVAEKTTNSGSTWTRLVDGIYIGIDMDLQFYLS